MLDASFRRNGARPRPTLRRRELLIGAVALALLLTAGVAVGVVTSVPQAPAARKARVPPDLPVVHLTAEVEVGDGQALDTPGVLWGDNHVLARYGGPPQA